MTCLDPKTIWPNEAVPNVRYRDFSKMVLFTAGDEDQFERKRSYKNGTNPDKKVSLDGNIWTNLFVPTEGLETEFWNGYITHSKIQFQDLQSERINLSKYYHLKILFYLVFVPFL